MRVKKKENDWSVVPQSLINETPFIHVKFFIFYARISPRVSVYVRGYAQC
jgi:hypothetical protein